MAQPDFYPKMITHLEKGESDSIEFVFAFLLLQWQELDELIGIRLRVEEIENDTWVFKGERARLESYSYDYELS